MKSLKVLGIIGIVIMVLFFFATVGAQDSGEINSVAGYSYLTGFYLLAISIVAIVQSKNINK